MNEFTTALTAALDGDTDRTVIQATDRALTDIHRDLLAVQQEIGAVLDALSKVRVAVGCSAPDSDNLEADTLKALRSVEEFARGARSSGTAQSNIAGATAKAGLVQGLRNMDLLAWR